MLITVLYCGEIYLQVLPDSLLMNVEAYPTYGGVIPPINGHFKKASQVVILGHVDQTEKGSIGCKARQMATGTTSGMTQEILSWIQYNVVYTDAYAHLAEMRKRVMTQSQRASILTAVVVNGTQRVYPLHTGMWEMTQLEWDESCGISDKPHPNDSRVPDWMQPFMQNSASQNADAVVRHTPLVVTTKPWTLPLIDRIRICRPDLLHAMSIFWPLDQDLWFMQQLRCALLGLDAGSEICILADTTADAKHLRNRLYQQEIMKNALDKKDVIFTAVEV